MVAVYIGHSLQIAHLVGEFFTTCNGQVPHLRLVNCGLAFFLLAKNSLNNLLSLTRNFLFSIEK